MSNRTDKEKKQTKATEPEQTAPLPETLAAPVRQDDQTEAGEEPLTLRELKCNLDDKLDKLTGAVGGVGSAVGGLTGEAMNIGRNTDRAANEAANIAGGIGSVADGVGDLTSEAVNIGRNTNRAADALGNISNQLGNVVTVRNTRAGITQTDDLALWVIIRRSAEALNFRNYARFMDRVLCGRDDNGNTLQGDPLYDDLRERRLLPFNDTDAYRLLKTATEAFLMVNGGVRLQGITLNLNDVNDLNARMAGGAQFDHAGLNRMWDEYLNSVNGTANPMLPYLAIISQKFRGEPLKRQIFLNEDVRLNNQRAERCVGVLRSKLQRPFLLELIWSYWQEEGMLAQALNAVTYRFQNRQTPVRGRDPLADLEIDPLRPLNNLLWGYVQDEQHRLSVKRRAYEYDHHYGITLHGKAVGPFRPADSRSKFLEAFHHLLYLCGHFFNQDDDTTRIADGFPILNALREVHLILSYGAHNQFGDLPSTARQEMLLQQWLLARPEFREYLPGRNMVTLPEPWMDRLEAMKKLQGWTDVSAIHFHNLAVFGEQILLSIRYGAWSAVNLPAQAANWARFWRAEIQGYVHAYRAVTGVDLSRTLTGRDKVDSLPPAAHLRNRLAAQTRLR
jgi:hypothetical protein